MPPNSLADTRREHLARTREIAQNHTLSTPGQQRAVSLREMMTWHQGKPDIDDDEQEWVVEHLSPGQGIVKRVCRQFGMRHWTPDAVGYAHDGFMSKVRACKL